MNEVIRQLKQRKSVRAFEERPIGRAEKQAILEAAVQAPTAGNQQLYTILDITDPEVRSSLVDTCDHQSMIGKAPMVLIFCADCKKWYDGFLAAGCSPRKPETGDLMLAVCDTLIAAQNAVTAAQSLGIGSCYIGDVMENCEAQRALLKLPDYVFPAAMVIFGYPTRQQEERPKPRRVELSCIVQENGYQPLTAEQLEQMWTPRAGKLPYQQWMERFCARKFNSDFSREMSRSVEEYLSQYRSESR